MSDTFLTITLNSCIALAFVGLVVFVGAYLKRRMHNNINKGSDTEPSTMRNLPDKVNLIDLVYKLTYK
jgi:hypothetical protein